MKLNDEQILHQIRGTTIERQAAIASLAANAVLSRDISTYVMKRDGDTDDGTMIFHDSVLAFVKRVFTDREFSLETSVEGYIFGIARMLWNGRYKSVKSPKITQSIELVILPNDDHVTQMKRDRAHLLHKVLDKLTPKCKEVLLYWAGSYSMSEIAQLVGYQSEGMARKKKCECFKALVKLLQEHPHLLAEFKN